MNQTLIKKGAEASLYLGTWHDKHVIIKMRLPKKYRPEQMDSTIRHYRTVHEPQLMHEAKRAGVPTPLIFLVDVANSTIIMQYIRGKQVKQVLDSAPEKQRREICVKIGSLVGKLHRCGLVHGDLTTSNMILTSTGKIFLVDFGLGDRNEELEAQGVDLHLLKRALHSIHFQVAEQCFKDLLEGYATERSSDATAKVLEKIREIEKRGRYVAERQQNAT